MTMTTMTTSTATMQLPPILAELLFFILVWEVGFAGFVKTRAEAWARRQAWWKERMTMPGLFVRKASHDWVLLFVLAAHHVVTGVVMLAAVATHNAHVWRLAALAEMGYELADFFELATRRWPYDPGQVDLSVKAALVLHHLPSTVLVIPVCISDVHANPHLGSMAGWMLLTAGLQCGLGCFIYTLDFENAREMKKAAVAHALTVAFYLYARFWVFPDDSAKFIESVKGRVDVHPLFPDAVWWGVAFMWVFNVVVLVKSVEKLAHMVWKVVDPEHELPSLRKVKKVAQ